MSPHPVQDSSSQQTQPRPPAGAPAMHACAACHQVFPEAMMSAVDAKWVCLLCKERALGDPIKGERAQYRMSSYVPDFRFWIIVLSILGWGIFFGVRVYLRNAKVESLKAREVQIQEAIKKQNQP